MTRPPRLALLAAGLAALAGCQRPPAARPEPPPAPVAVAVAAVRTVSLQVRAIGTVKTISTVSIRPRVGGELVKVHFHEGEFVRKKQKLFTIDPRPYESALKKAEADRARDNALLLGAELELKRVEQGGAGGVVAAAEVDTARTAFASAKATLAADDAAVRSAQIQLDYTTIVSPIDGRAGGLLLTEGNLVTANEPNPLVVINQISPIHVAFALPEHDLARVAAAQAKSPLKVEATARGGPPAVGVVEFIDNAVDPTTGTVMFKARFPNDDRSLWPGQFLDVVVTVGERAESVVVPGPAVQSGQQGSYVFVVTPGKTADLRKVDVAFEAGGDAVIAAGLKGGETVVVEGQLRLSRGSRVQVKGGGSDAPPQADGPAAAGE